MQLQRQEKEEIKLKPNGLEPELELDLLSHNPRREEGIQSPSQPITNPNCRRDSDLL